MSSWTKRAEQVRSKPRRTRRILLAPAKVNLALHVTGRREDGYHTLDSLVAFADMGDRLTVAPGDSLTVRGPFAAGVPTDDSNLIRRALARAEAPRAVTLEKRLPHPAGLGGGSSDAACALRAVGVELSTEVLMHLGADIPVCLLGSAARMQGAGEHVTPVAMPPLAAVLVNPGLPVPTGAVFSRLARRDNPGMGELPEAAEPANWITWLSGCRNDLEAPACALVPEIETVLSELRAVGADLVRMSGSGATCFGLWIDRAAAAAAARALQRPGWWVQTCTLA